MSNPVGIIGLGIMGSAYAKNLSAAGFEVIGYDVDESRYAALGNTVVTPAASPADVAAKADRILTALPNAKALLAVASGPGSLAEAPRKVVVSDMCTLALADKEAARSALEAAGHVMLDCAVSGTGAQAAVADLVVFGSGDEKAFDSMRPIYQAIGRVVHYLGAFGNGSRMKYVANLLVTIHNVSTAEAMAFGIKAGIDPQTIYDVLAGSAGSSRIFEIRGPMMVEGVYDQKVSATHRMMQKDISVITDYARSIACPTPLFAVAAEIHDAAVAQGFELADTASVCAVMERLAGAKRRK